jgi:hypothetical protein
MPRYSWEERRREHHARRVVHHARIFHLRYGNLTITILGVLAGLWLVYNPEKIVLFFGNPNLGYLGSFVIGLSYPFGATTPAAIAGFYSISKTVSPIEVSVLGIAGSMVSNYVIFYFIRHKLLDYLDDLARRFNVRMHLMRYSIQKSRIKRYTITILAGIILTSPLPTEIAVGLLAAVKYDIKRFMFLAFAFQFPTILTISFLGRAA